MKAIFLILFIFATFIIFLGYSSETSSGIALGKALMFGGAAIYAGILITWILFKVKERSDSE